VILESSLGDREEIGRGAASFVHRLLDFRLPDVEGALVYKQYRIPEQGPASGSHLDLLVSRRQLLSDADRRRLDDCTAWPVAVVGDETGLCTGVLMPLVSDRFVNEVTLPSGARSRVPREVQHLFVPPRQTARFGYDVPADPSQRILLCREFAAAIQRLHDMGIVFGDISARNALYGLAPEPCIMLVDCDAVRVLASSRPQENSPDWEPPETTPGQAVLSFETDRYKVALFVLRCLTPGPQASTAVDPEPARDALGDAGVQLLRDGLGRDGALRPTAGRLAQFLDRRLHRLEEPPTVVDVELTPSLVAAGVEVDVRWVVDDADTVVVSAPGEVEERTDAAGPGERTEGVTRVRLWENGRVRVTAVNRCGRVDSWSPPGFVFDPSAVVPQKLMIPGAPDLATWLPMPSVTADPVQTVLSQLMPASLGSTPDLPSLRLPIFPALPPIPELPPIPDPTPPDLITRTSARHRRRRKDERL
jgi:hypothetical protein